MSNFVPLSHLDENTLGYIGELSGPTGLCRLLKTGNGLLRLKLCNGVRHFSYSNNKNGQVSWNYNLLNQLKGLKRLSVFAQHCKSSHCLLSALPSTILDIRIGVRNSFALCYEDDAEGPESTERLPFNFAWQFPELQTLAIVEAPNSRDDLEGVGVDWFLDHLPLLPPCLTSLHVSCGPFDSDSLEDLPRTLRSLSFKADPLRGFSWISGLKELTDLSISSLSTWIVPTSEMEESLAPHPALRTLIVEDLNAIIPIDHDVPHQDAIDLFYAYFAHLTHLEVPSLRTPTEICSEWKGHFLSIFDAGSVKPSIRPQMSTSITHLMLSTPLEHWLPYLPRFLRYLSLPNCNLTTGFSWSILPPTLTALYVSLIDGELAQFGPHLPPSLTYLRTTISTMRDSFSSVAPFRAVNTFLTAGKAIDASFCEQVSSQEGFEAYHELNLLLPKTLQFVELDYWPYFRHPDPSKTIAGWTNLTLAAAISDFDSLERIADGSCVPSLGMPLTPLERASQMNFTELLDWGWVSQIPVKTLEWLNFIDFHNPTIAEKFYTSCVLSQFELQIEWGLKQITPELWRSKGSSLIFALPLPRQLPMMKFMETEMGMDINQNIDEVQRLAICSQNLDLVLWYHDRGFAEIFIENLQPHFLGRARPYANLEFLQKLVTDRRLKFVATKMDVSACMIELSNDTKRSFSQRVKSLEYAEWLLEFARSCLPPDLAQVMDDFLRERRSNIFSM